ncbi:MAG: hypothetical protein J5931_08655 [Prevotella sp.]|nr:hypothetical protein [Prevotella sp.]
MLLWAYSAVGADSVSYDMAILKKMREPVVLSVPDDICVAALYHSPATSVASAVLPALRRGSLEPLGRVSCFFFNTLIEHMMHFSRVRCQNVVYLMRY